MEPGVTVEQTPAERIRQRRAQMLVHSCAYYLLDRPMVSDATWQRWADELAVLQLLENCSIDFYDREFADWDGTTGMHLPQDAWVLAKTNYVLALHDGLDLI